MTETPQSPCCAGKTALQMCIATERRGHKHDIMLAAAVVNPAVWHIYTIRNTVNATVPPTKYDRI